MKLLIKKIAKPIAIGVFFMALFFNVKFSIEDPFFQISNLALAQTSSSSSSSCENPTPKGCWNTITARVGWPAMYCGTCTYVNNSEGSGSTGTCMGC